MTISLKEVVITLIEAIALVVRDVPVPAELAGHVDPDHRGAVVLLGTFGVLAAFGYSINTLTMFALVLAIGLLVDDAIVVVENVERVMTFEGLAPKPATLKAMGQITGALVGIVLVLTAVFLPMAFFSGVTGVIYRQFSVTIAAAMILSVLVAMTITPALCGSILHQIPKGGHPHGDHAGEPGCWASSSSGSTIASSAPPTDCAIASTASSAAHAGVLFYLVLSVATGLLLWHLPGAFLPDEDQGMLNALVKLPAGSTLEQTRAVMDASVRGSAGRQRAVDPGHRRFQCDRQWPERGPGVHPPEGTGTTARMTPTPLPRLTRAMASVPDAQVFITSPPAILGRAMLAFHPGTAGRRRCRPCRRRGRAQTRC